MSRIRWWKGTGYYTQDLGDWLAWVDYLSNNRKLFWSTIIKESNDDTTYYVLTYLDDHESRKLVEDHGFYNEFPVNVEEFIKKAEKRFEK